MWAIASLGLTTGNKQLAVTFCPADANDNIDFRDWQGHLIEIVDWRDLPAHPLSGITIQLRTLMFWAIARIAS
jgi:hypothetical protein